MHYQEQSDETLVMLTLAGEQSAYEVLVIRYEKAVISAAYSVIQNRSLAEDAAQDAFITAWMKLNILREPKKYGPWVCRIAKNCAKNMAVRFRGFLGFDVMENRLSEDERCQNPEFMYVSSEESELLRESISNLPEKVKTVINLYYFEGLSIAEIADRMRISAGTVKLQLHNGRKRIRKELSAMNEEMNDTLVQRVMKKVEELKLWKLKNNKNGFEEVYEDVLNEVEQLPESTDKYHTMADVLVRGWWWIPGKQDDELLARISEMAELGKNEEVMRFLVAQEDGEYGIGRIEFIRDKQIPRLEAKGFTKTLGYEWFWLGYSYFENNEPEKGFEAYNKVLSILKPSDFYYVFTLANIEMQKKYADEYKNKDYNKIRLIVYTNELHIKEGKLRYCWNEDYICTGGLLSNTEFNDILKNASYCDGNFTVDGAAKGESFTGSDGNTLTFVSDTESVQTPCGTFDSCQLWITKNCGTVYKTYFKTGIGIVKQETFIDGITETQILKSYNIFGGTGIIPFAKGNTWEYISGYNPEYMNIQTKFTVQYADEKSVILSGNAEIERVKYDENSWLDMILQIRNEYFDHNVYKVCDVYHAIERAQVLAKTPLEKAHTKAACSVARRILNTNPQFNPNYTATGHWNFFKRHVTEKVNSKIKYSQYFCWSFELKLFLGDNVCDSLLYNDIYDIFNDNVGCLWSDDWKAETEFTIKHIFNEEFPIETKLCFENVGSITTKAGTFENCLKCSIETDGFCRGIGYRGGKKEYYFAPGIGIVRTVNYYYEDTCKAVYELTAYEGTGEGYMPIADGMIRRYDAIDLTDGYVAGVEYTYCANDDGQIIIFSDQCGIKKKFEKITQYGSVLGEKIEEDLWNQGKYEESRLRHDVNNFNILVHFLTRENRNWAMPEKAAAWSKYRMNIIENFGKEGEIPRAWLGLYIDSCFRVACAMFGYGNKDEGYQYLDNSIEMVKKWLEIPDGELLEVGNEMIYGGIKVVKGKVIIELPDGTREAIYSYDAFDFDIGIMYNGMTAPSGWEWFNSVRDEERFKQAIERVKALMK